MSVICKSSFFNYIWWRAETLFLYYLTVVHYYMSSGFKLFDTHYSERENWIWPHDKTKLKWRLIFLLKKNFVLSQFQVFLRAEMHILIFLTVPLFVPPCDACGSGKMMYSLDFSHLRHTKKNRNIIEDAKVLELKVTWLEAWTKKRIQNWTVKDCGSVMCQVGWPLRWPLVGADFTQRKFFPCKFF